jgi:hypothetical protein
VVTIRTNSCDVYKKHRKDYNGMATSTGWPEDRIPKLILEWTPEERRKRGSSRKTWMEEEQAAMTRRNVGSDQWRNGEEWRFVSGGWRQLL